MELTTLMSISRQQQQNGMFDKLETGELNTIDFIDGMMKICRIQMKKKSCPLGTPCYWAYQKRILNLFIIFPNKCLSTYYQIQMGFTYNTSKKSQVSHLEFPSIKSLFTTTYLSHEIGLRKPNKEAFEWVLSDANINAHETLYIDDSIQHINSAKDLGIKSVLWKQNKPLRATFLDKAL